MELELVSDETGRPKLEGFDAVTDENGVARFFKVPQTKNLRVHVKNEPVGAKGTHRGRNGKGAERDSEYDRDGYSERFNLHSFHGDGACGFIDLGYMLPHDVEVSLEGSASA